MHLLRVLGADQQDYKLRTKLFRIQALNARKVKCSYPGMSMATPDLDLPACNGPLTVILIYHV